MKQKEKAIFIQNTLDRLFPDPQIPLQYTNPYTFLIAVILSAQCTDLRVNQISPSLFALASTPEEMLALGTTKIEDIIRPCGLSKRKAQAIFSLSHLLMTKHQGEIPTTLEELMALPGVGRKTASVILSSLFKLPAFPVDTHIHRCAERWGFCPPKSTVRIAEEAFRKYFPPSSWSRLHLQLIYYARTFCPARGHKKEQCPICSKLAEPHP